jgi:hypothetical protein
MKFLLQMKLNFLHFMGGAGWEGTDRDQQTIVSYHDYHAGSCSESVFQGIGRQGDHAR